jgi:isopentenyl diphosphate isomerase/L-lactate dehydrogenase-like FMN-dependent dehydrogenase
MSPNGRRMLSVKDLEDEFMKLTEKQDRDYIQSGANEMQSVLENMSGFDNYWIRGRAMVDVSIINTKAKNPLLGKYSVPIGIAPSAFHQMVTPEGEYATA